MDIQMLIDGEERHAEGKATFDRIDPVTKEVATRAPASSVKDAIAAADSAAAAFPAWSKTSPSARRAILNKAADVLESKTADFTALMIKETGSTGPWGGFNVYFACTLIREAAAMTTQIIGEVIPANKPGSLAMGMRQARGVCFGMAPWNAPVILGVRAVAMAIACGNSVVLKASEMCPATHRLIGQCFLEAGLPKGVLNVITNAPKDANAVVKAMIAHPAVKHINFTGSTKVGKVIALLAAEHLKPVLLELGGKAPLLVLDDADIDAAVNAVIFGAFMNQGQICMSTERIIVDNKIADEFTKKLSERAAKLPAGNPRDKVVLGSMVTEEAATKMDGLISDAKAKGAKLTAGGKRTGSIVEATLLDGVTAQMRIYTEESFGPVKPIIRVSGDEEAIRVANDTEYGLSAAVYSRDIRRAMDVAARIESGICHINGPTVGDEGQMPFGGVKQSGYGRFGGTASVNEFTVLRWITIEDPQQHYPF